METKRCRDCGLEKPLSEFHAYGKRAIPDSRCILCERVYDRKQAKHLRLKKRREELRSENERLRPLGRQICSFCFARKGLSEFSTSMPNRKGKLNKVCDSCLTQMYSYKSKDFSPEFWRRRAYACNCVARVRLKRILGSLVDLKDLPYICKPQDLADLFKQQAGNCFYCGCQLETKLTRQRENPNAVSVDHKLPLGKGGEHTKENLVLCCYACNSLKAGMDEAQFKKFLFEYAQRILSGRTTEQTSVG